MSQPSQTNMPHTNSQSSKELRKSISTSLLSILYGLCFAQLAITIKDESVFKIWDFMIVASTFLTAVRFYVGNYSYLCKDTILNNSLSIWIYDVIVFLVQCIVFIGLASVSTINSNKNIQFGFYQILILVLMIDVFWIYSQHVIGLCFKRWKRTDIPVKWAHFNLLYVVILFGIIYFNVNSFSPGSIIILFSINFIAFIIDVIYIDYSQLGK